MGSWHNSNIKILCFFIEYLSCLSFMNSKLLTNNWSRISAYYSYSTCLDSIIYKMGLNFICLGKYNFLPLKYSFKNLILDIKYLFMISVERATLNLL